MAVATPKLLPAYALELYYIITSYYTISQSQAIFTHLVQFSVGAAPVYINMSELTVVTTIYTVILVHVQLVASIVHRVTLVLAG